MSDERVIVERLAPRHRQALVSLMSAVSTGCYCRFWDFEGEDNDWLARCASGDNQQALEDAVTGGDIHGVVASIEGSLVGWLKLAPAGAMAKLEQRRVYRTLSCFEDRPPNTWVIGCILVHPTARRRGVAKALVGGAVGVGRELGASAIEAFPRIAAHALGEHELQMGPASIYQALGFEVVDGPDPYPVMRKPLL